jgi:demethylmenaquinone methyltransferase/2-methoxy-6-polyprenyl-1,4-benzoquinol methylase
MRALPPPGATQDVRARFVRAAFTVSAPWYDSLTRVFSFGLDARWRRAALERCELRPGHALLDVATGTGELAGEARRPLGPTGVAVGLDVCGAMLDEACRKRGTGVSWVEGQAEALPFRPATFDCVTLGFALRHFDLERALGEIARVLKPGGRFVVVEWTRPEGGLARRVLLGYMRHVVPPLVGLISRDRRVADLARYLSCSIEHFMSGPRLSQRLEAAGLPSNGRREFFLGLVSICVGVKAGVTADPRGAMRGASASPARRGSPPVWGWARQKRWVIVGGGAVLGIVAVQLILSLVDLLTR